MLNILYNLLNTESETEVLSGYRVVLSVLVAYPGDDVADQELWLTAAVQHAASRGVYTACH